MKGKKHEAQASSQPAKPPSYDQAVAAQTGSSPEGGAGSGAATAVADAPTATQPSDIIVGDRHAVVADAFGTNVEDDHDRKQRKPDIDAITRAVGTDTFYYKPDEMLDAVRNSAGSRHSFTRRYYFLERSIDVLVDVFARDGKDIRKEVEQKRVALAAHNKAVEEKCAAVMAIEDPDDRRRALTDLRWRKNIQFGYAPVFIGRYRNVDFVGAREGQVLDLSGSLAQPGKLPDGAMARM
jgi:hypothetical protein